MDALVLIKRGIGGVKVCLVDLTMYSGSRILYTLLREMRLVIGK